MLKHLPFSFGMFGCFIFLFVAIGLIALSAVVLPILQAPKLVKIAKYARRCLKGNPDLSKSELRSRLVLRFAPERTRNREFEASTFFLFGLVGIFIHWMAGFVLDTRFWISNNIVNSRIDQVIEAISRKWDEE